MKSKKFTIGLLDTYDLIIPSEFVRPFIEKHQNRVKVKATSEYGSISFYAALKKDRDSGDYRIMFSKRLQKELGIFQNDYFEIQLFEDTSKYGVDMPEELEAVLVSDDEAYRLFESFTVGKQRSIIYAILRIKNTQSRVDKALLLCENLKRGITDAMLLLKS